MSEPMPNTNPGHSLSRAIRRARLEHKLTQGELAVRVRVSQSTISFWESGIETPTVEHLILLASELPAIVEHLQGYERELLQRLLVLERDLFAGRCACAGCNCEPQTSR